MKPWEASRTGQTPELPGEIAFRGGVEGVKLNPGEGRPFSFTLRVYTLSLFVSYFQLLPFLL